MLDETILQKVIDKSIDPDGLRHYLGISIDEMGRTSWGPFYGLNENCCASLGIENCNPDKIANVLNAYNISAVSINDCGYYDPSKILVTETGIKLPMQMPEDAIEQINDIVNVFKANNINIQGYIHPITKDGITKSVPRTTQITGNIQIDCSTFDDIEIKEILERRQTTFDEFVGKQLDEALSNAMSEDAIIEITNANYMKSLYRGGILNQPYATVAARESKDFVYASSEFTIASMYAEGGETAGGEIGYKKINGHSYGFIYEYEIAPDQKFTKDYGLEEGVKKSSIEQLGGKAYETDVYPHQNKLKSIYLSVDGKSGEAKIYKIADETGYISSEWEDFVNLHPTKSMPSSQVEVTRNNEMYKLSQEGKISSEYNGKSYELKPQSIDNYLKEQLSSDIVNIGKNGKYTTLYPLILKEIPDGADLSSLDKCYLAENASIGKNVKLPDEVIINGHIQNAMDLSNVKNLRINGDITFGKDVKLPENTIFDSECRIKGHIPNGVDLSKIDNLVLEDIVSIGSEVKLPNAVRISGYIPDGTDLSNVEKLTLTGDITFGKDVKLPQSPTWYCNSVSGYIPNGTEINTRLAGDVWLGKDCKYDNCYIYSEEPPRLHGNVEYNKSLKGADFSKVESLSFPKGTKITQNMILPENRNVIFPDHILVDKLETIHKIARYDVGDCIVYCSNYNNKKINSLPNNINIVISDEDKIYAI